MTQVKNRLNRVTSYHTVQIPEDFYSGILLPGVKSRSVRAKIKDLLYYEGIGELKVAGSFMAHVPKITNLPIGDIVELLDISKSTFYRAKKDDSFLAMDTVDKLSSLLKIYQKGIEAFEGQEPFVEWLNTKIPNLGGKRPIDLLKTENGRITVLDAIDRVEYGVYG